MTWSRDAVAPRVADVELAGLITDYGGVLDTSASDGGEVLIDVIERLRAAGIGAALLSNADTLPRDQYGPDLGRLFDRIVLSGEVGIAKPELEIYRKTARLLGLDEQRCVFVDDLASNVAAAVDVGMVGVLHRDLGTTCFELEILFGIDRSD